MVSLILKDIKEFNLEDRTLITSYDFRILYALKKQNPNILRGFITLQQGFQPLKKIFTKIHLGWSKIIRWKNYFYYLI